MHCGLNFARLLSCLKVMMKPLAPSKQEERDHLLAEYARLTIVAAESLLPMPVRDRPNWLQFYGAHERIGRLIARIKEINGA